jgi:Cd2+/Zn2+-exporting ATPase
MLSNTMTVTLLGFKHKHKQEYKHKHRQEYKHKYKHTHKHKQKHEHKHKHKHKRIHIHVTLLGVHGGDQFRCHGGALEEATILAPF